VHNGYKFHEVLVWLTKAEFMPELPEVETVKRGLEPALTGRQIIRVELRRKNLRFPFPERFRERLEGASVEAVSRRAKYILVHLDTGEALILHLGMTGRFTIAHANGAIANLGEFYFETGSAGDARGPHDHVVIDCDDGTRVIYSDPRRFGMMDLGGLDHKLLKDIGIEPLGNELSGAWLADKFRGKSAPLKAALLDQRIVAGLGNIYVCEALHRARLSPSRKAGSLVRKKSYDPRLDLLVQEIRSVLHEAIAAGGSTLQDYQAVDGARGEFQQRFLVYGREGEACGACGRPISRLVQSGRSTFHCTACQK
jgi:formamidopyrimidine-DNA glycosylase